MSTTDRDSADGTEPRGANGFALGTMPVGARVVVRWRLIRPPIRSIRLVSRFIHQSFQWQTQIVETSPSRARAQRHTSSHEMG